MLMRRLCSLFAALAATLVLFAAPTFAQDGKLKIHVTPKQAYVFVDGKAIREGSRTMTLSAGKHTVVVVNYGYKITSKDVDIEAGKTTNLDVPLEAYGGPVAGPWGRIRINGNRRAAVLLNGKKPDYFVGHVDEFDWDWIWHQELLVPPGTHQVTVTRDGKEIWSGPVTVAANQAVTIDLGKNAVSQPKEWKRGTSLMKKSPLPRFKAGTASTTVAVAPVTNVKISADNPKIDCGQSSNLSWSGTDAVDANISNIGDVATSGNQSVSPHQTTTYDLTETGPGGVAKGSQTLDVNIVIQSSISLNPPEVRYRRIGDKVIEQGSSTLTWSTSNASTVAIDPIGSVSPSGTQTVQANPKQTANGPVDETTNYTLNASNVCGGTATQTAALHITGSIEPIPEVILASIFYPTDYPDRRHAEAGLLRSQQDALTTAATGFKKYLEYDPDAKLAIAAHSDVRGSKRYNQELSERRVARIKEFLVTQGVAADKVQTAAYGKDQQLDRKEVKKLEEDNPNKAPAKPRRGETGNYYAYNRRADIVLQPSGKKSTMFYPNDAPDVKVLWQVPKPSLKVVEKNQ
ncbi:MAG: OmpA family protein [Candidatus Acidiferrales bacterium]